MKKQEEPKKRGRPRLQDEELSAQVVVRVTTDQLAKYQRLGASKWLRQRINKAKEPQS